jgi:hypothetical protein
MYVSLVSSKIVRRWRYHIRNYICGVAQTPYASWDCKMQYYLGRTQDTLRVLG